MKTAEEPIASVSAVMARMTDALWQADASGRVTSITPCRPSRPAVAGALDETELQQIEQLWRKSVRCAEHFSTIFHVRSPIGSAARSFALHAIPVLDDRDEVRHWAGSATEVDRFADLATRFMSEASTVLSSSLNRATIVNRLIQVSIDHFCDLCAVHVVDDDGSLHVEAIADRRTDTAAEPDGLAEALASVLRTGQPALLLSETVWNARSMLVVPLFIGANCIGTLSFLESERPSSFVPRDLDVASVVAGQLALALANIKTFEREQRTTERFRFLARVSASLFTASLDSTKMLHHLLDSLVGGFADYAVAASMVGGRLRRIAESGPSASAFRDENERAVIAALEERRSILMSAEPDAGRTLEPLSEVVRPLSWMMVPLFSGDTVYGTIICCSHSHRYDRNDLELLEEIGRRASLALEHSESFARERRLTDTLQQATLPAQLAGVEGASLSAVYRPADSDVRVGGDWYDAFELDNRRVLLTVGDVTGHGLQASIVMGKLRHAINVIAMYERNPVRILNAAERVLLRRFPGSVATAFVAILDPIQQTITYANAGHPYPIVRHRDGALKELKADGLPIGLRSVGEEGSPVTEPLVGDSLLLFYTDGLTEATRDPLAGEQLLRQALSSDAVCFAGSPARFIERFCVRTQSPDDVAILALNFVQSKRWAFDSYDWRAARIARREFVACVQSAAAPESDLKAAELIFGELAANVAQHAAGPVEIALDWRAPRAVLHMIDNGNGYASSERRDADLLTEHGRGLWLVQRLGAQLEVEILPGFGTHVAAVLPVTLRE